MDEDDIYDTAVYSDYADLPKETRKALYNEYLKSDAGEKQLSRIIFVVPLIFYIAIAALLVAATAVAITVGIGVTFITLVMCAAAVIAGLIIVKINTDKAKYAHEVRFAAWLKTEKHVIAVPKDDIKSDKKQK